MLLIVFVGLVRGARSNFHSAVVGTMVRALNQGPGPDGCVGACRFAFLLCVARVAVSSVFAFAGLFFISLL